MSARADVILCLARLALAAALLPAGLARALNVSGFALTLAGTGMPYPNAVATGLVVVNVFGPLALVAGVVPRLAGLGLAAFSLVTALLLHRFWDLPPGALRAGEQELFLAGIGLAAGAALHALAGPGAWSWQGLRHAPPRAAPAKPAAAKVVGKPARPGPRKRPAERLAKAA